MAIPVFIEVQFPTSIQYGAEGGVEFSTDVIEVKSGYDRRDQLWNEGRGPWSVNLIRTTDELDDLIAFFRVMRGRAVGFRFKDKSDYSATDEILGTGDGNETDFQLRKAYTDGVSTVYRTILKPVAGTVRVYLDDVEQLSGWTVDTTTGMISFDTPPGAEVVVTADFEFDLKARLDTDFLNIIREENRWVVNGLAIVELS